MVLVALVDLVAGCCGGTDFTGDLVDLVTLMALMTLVAPGVGDQHRKMHRLHNVLRFEEHCQNINVDGFSKTSPKHR